jgi:N-acetyl-anhydromuramyl-L-alanine amidase AmpD
MGESIPVPDGWTIGYHYVKSARWPVGYGYSPRLVDPSTGDVLPWRGLVIHTTEHGPGQTPAACWAYLRDSPDVSAHYGIGPDGSVERILDPGLYVAWHAGISACAGRPNCNRWMLGVELFHRAGSGPIPPAALQSLTTLCRVLRADWPALVPAYITTHRAVALPVGRKADPSDWDDAAFAEWRAGLDTE